LGFRPTMTAADHGRDVPQAPAENAAGLRIPQAPLAQAGRPTGIDAALGPASGLRGDRRALKPRKTTHGRGGRRATRWRGWRGQACPQVVGSADSLWSLWR